MTHSCHFQTYVWSRPFCLPPEIPNALLFHPPCQSASLLCFKLGLRLTSFRSLSLLRLPASVETSWGSILVPAVLRVPSTPVWARRGAECLADSNSPYGSYSLLPPLSSGSNLSPVSTPCEFHL